MALIICLLTLLAEWLSLIAIVLGIAVPRWRAWPPRKPGAWSQYAMVALFNLSGAGVILCGLLDSGSLPVPWWARLGIGLPAWLAGLALALWATQALGLPSTLGMEDVLVRYGPYQYSRHPQYAGLMLALPGWALLTASGMTLAAALAALPPLILSTYVEEPWLREKYGYAFERYQQSVARFFGRR